MGLITSSVTCSRLWVPPHDMPENWTDIYRDRLEEFSFIEPAIVGKAPVEGWTLLQDLMISSFEDPNRWRVGEWIVFALRTDKRKVPAKRFAALVKMKCREWASEHDVQRCPSTVKTEIKDTLEAEIIQRIEPSTSVTEVTWNYSSGVVYVSSHSDSVRDVIRKRFFRTFGVKLMIHSPLDWIRGNDSLVEEILATTSSVEHQL